MEKKSSTHLFWVEQALGAAKDRVLRRVVRVVFGGDLQDRRQRCVVRVNHVPDDLGHLEREPETETSTRKRTLSGPRRRSTHILVDQDDVDVVSFDERLDAVLNVRQGGV